MSNPYSPPASHDYAQAGSGGAAVPADAVEALRDTRPWVTLVAVLGFIGTGLMGLLGVAALVLTNETKMPTAFGVIYILLAVVYLLPSLLLMRYASSIGRLIDGAGIAGLVDALRRQRSFWRAVGIMALVFVALMVLSLFVTGIFMAGKKPF